MATADESITALGGSSAHRHALTLILDAMNEDEGGDLQLEELFGPTTDELMKVLGSIGLADKVLDFYRHTAPRRVVEAPNLTSLYDVASMMTCNLAATPGVHLVAHNYLVIGQHSNGDGLCVGRYERRDDGDSSIFVAPARAAFETKSQVDQTLIKVADTFGDFLDLFATETLPNSYYGARNDQESRD